MKYKDGVPCSHEPCTHPWSGSCSHLMTEGRKDNKGSWCVDCGVKVYDVEERECKDCNQFFSSPSGYSGCKKRLMAVSPDMNVTYNVEDGTCWSDR